MATNSTSASESESNNSRPTANAVTLGSAITGQLSTTTDIDYYAVAVTAAGTLTLVFDVPTDSTYQDYFKLGLYDASGTVLALFTTGQDKTYSLGAPAAGTYYVGVAVGSSSYYNSNQYSVTASHVAGSANGSESEANNAIATADAVTLGSAYNWREHAWQG